MDWHAAVAGGSLEDMLGLPSGQGAMVAQQLGVDTIVLQPALLLPEQVVRAVKAGETPARHHLS